MKNVLVDSAKCINKDCTNGQAPGLYGFCRWCWLAKADYERQDIENLQSKILKTIKKEKICPDCLCRRVGRYCSNCGKVATPPRVSLFKRLLKLFRRVEVKK